MWVFCWEREGNQLGGVKGEKNHDSCHDPPPRAKVSHLTSSTYSLNHCTISFPIWWHRVRSRLRSLSGHEKLDAFGGTECERPCDVGCASACVGCGWRSGGVPVVPVVVVIVAVAFEAVASAE